ncbi:MAG: hypothetical protein U0527_07255 [Candidatus Eisenbacteria bacterium]
MNLQGVQCVLYRLGDLLAEPEAWVYLVEGEKDADNLHRLGLVATTNPMGAGKWRNDYNESLRGRHVVILPDNDEPGETHARDVARRLSGIAASVRVVELPGLPPKGDVSDWLAAGGNRQALEALAASTPEWSSEPRDEATEPSDCPHEAAELPQIDVGGSRAVEGVWDEAAEALRLANHPPSIFVRSGVLVRVRQDERHSPIVDNVNEAMLRGRLARVARFVRRRIVSGRAQVCHVTPPKEAVQDILARGQWPGIPALEAVVETPVLRPDGSILDQAGYDPATRLLFIPAKGLHIPAIPAAPSRDDAVAALRLLEDLIHDFPFVDDASRAAALAHIMTPILRPAIRGPVPMALFDSPQQGTGKTKLATAAGVIATGREPSMTTAPATPEEWRKKITSLLLSAPVLIVFDNVIAQISSEHLASALTASVWQDRELGWMKVTQGLPQRAVWCATGNNLSVGGDLGRRCYLSRIDARMSEPWKRESGAFRHPDLIGWVGDHRGELVAAILTIARAWYLAGCPAGCAKEIGFPGWSQTLGGVLAFVGVPGFLGNVDEFYGAADTESSEWESFLAEWHERLRGPARASEVAEALAASQDFRESLPGWLAEVYAKDSKGSFPKKLGWALRQRRSRRYGSDGLHVTEADEDGRKSKAWVVRNAIEAAVTPATAGGFGVSPLFSSLPPTESSEREICSTPGSRGEKNPENQETPDEPTFLDWPREPGAGPEDLDF